MDLESLENVRAEATRTTMETLSSIVKDDKVDMKDRLEAAKILDAYSDSLIKAHMMNGAVDMESKTRRQMINKLDRLTDSEK